MKKTYIFLTIFSLITTANLYASDLPHRAVILYKGEKQPQEISTIFIPETQCLNHIYISKVDGQKVATEYHSNMNKYLVLPGNHEIVVAYGKYLPGKVNGKRKEIFLKTYITINAKPNYYYALFQNIRKYASEPVTMRVHEYKSGERYFDLYRRDVKSLKSQIEKLDSKKDAEKISNKYFELARKYEKLKEYDNAIRAYENAIKYNPKKAALYGMVIPSLIELKEYTKAFEIIKKMKKHEKREWITDGLYGEVYGGMEQYDKAITYLNKAAEGAPIEHKEGLRGRLAYFYKEAGMDEEYRLAMKKTLEDRDEKGKLYLKITREMMSITAEMKNTQLSADEKKATQKKMEKLKEKYQLDDDKLYEVFTSTMYKHGKELEEEHGKQE